MGAVESLDALCLAIGLPLGGALVALSYPRLAFLVVGLGGTTASVALFRVSRGEPEHTANDRERAGDGADPASLLHEPSRDGHAGRDEHRAHEARTEEIHSASPAPQAPQAP
jgi:hypothetical protein